MIGIRRSWVVYITYLALIALDLNRILTFLDGRSPILLIVLIFSFVLLNVTFVRLVIMVYYILIDDHQVTIVKDFFKTESFTRDLLASINLNENPFGHDHFVLKDGSKVAFNYDYLKRANFKKLQQVLNVPVT